MVTSIKNDFKIKINGDILAETSFQPTKKSNAEILIFMNGSGGTRERFYDYGKFFSDIGYIVICFDFRGRGDSPKENATLKDHIGDTEAIIKYVLALKPSNKVEITLVSTSIGSHSAMSICNISPAIKKLILIAPGIVPKIIENKNFKKITKKDFNEPESNIFRPIEQIKRFSGEVYVVSLSLDKTIPSWMIQMCLDNSKKAKKVEEIKLNNVPHSIFRHKIFKNKIKNLLIRIL